MRILLALLLSGCVSARESQRRVDAETTKRMNECTNIQEDIIRSCEDQKNNLHGKWVVMFCLRDEQLSNKIALLLGTKPAYYDGCEAIRGAYTK